MIDICVQRQGNMYVPFSEHDRKAGLVFPERQVLRAKISGSKKVPHYTQLCAYFGSCEYIASLAFNKNMNSKDKVDYLTRLKCDFVKDTVIDHRGLLQWRAKSLSYENCDQPDRTEFISKALESHADLVGVPSVDEYLKGLKRQ